MARIHHVLSYDITNDKRRRKLVKLMEQVALRVQYSVFETTLSGKEVHLLVQRSLEFVNPSEGDSLRIYRICRNCAKHFHQIGGREIDWEKDFVL
nr:CRISPR-associated endonuclease Cas2 [uncultured Dethiosulfovibrio sp.]